MKRYLVFAVCLLALSISIPTFAQDPQGQQEQRGSRRQGGRHQRADLQKMDANNDGVISRDEWKGRPQAFDRIDKNNDGSLTREEIASVARAKGERRFGQMDANNDGRISREEWKGNAELFTRLDTNNDGAITKEELKGRRRKR